METDLLAQEATRKTGAPEVMALHQQRFRCHVCGEPSAGPRIRLAWRLTDEPQPIALLEPDWTTPTQLWRCRQCGEWSCAHHVVFDTCAHASPHPQP